ncbi:MAG: MFS transporter [Ferroplasma sp.]
MRAFWFNMMRSFNKEQASILSLVSLTIGLRTLGLFMVLPVFTLYGEKYTDSYLLIGFALGAYGITMAIFQTPLGRLSDRYGRKLIISIGVATFIIGNIICAYPVNIYGLILGRLIEGAGAVSAAGIALIHENVPTGSRNIADAIIGIGIGLSFMLGVVIGPILATAFSFSSLFIIAGIIGAISLIPLFKIHEKKKVKMFREKHRIDSRLAVISIIGFFIYFYMIVFYYYLPIFSLKYFKVSDFYEFLIPIVFIAGIVGLAIARPADKNKTVLFSLVSLVVLFISVPLYFLNTMVTNIDYFGLGIVAFFSGYIISEIVFPTLVTRLAPEGSYGGNLGFYTSMQHAGVFLGAVVAGLLIINIDRDIAILLLISSVFILSIVLLYSITKFREIYLFKNSSK